MPQSRPKRIIGWVLGCLVVLLLVCGVWLRVQRQKAKRAFPAEQVIASIRTATAAKPGDVWVVESVRRGGKTFCEVEILALDGKIYEVAVDVGTNTVVNIKVD